MDIICYVFEGITALDVIGPYEVLARLPGAELRFVGEKVGPIRTDNQVLGIVADHARADVTSADVLVMPGGFATRDLETDAALLEWIRAIDATSTWTTSVCTGSMLLAAAGLLEGKRATTHWASLERLREYGAIPTSERVVEEGKYVTAAGVSSGIDMALTLAGAVAGDEVAQEGAQGRGRARARRPCGAPTRGQWGTGARLAQADALRLRLSHDPQGARRFGPLVATRRALPVHVLDVDAELRARAGVELEAGRGCPALRARGCGEERFHGGAPG